MATRIEKAVQEAEYLAGPGNLGYTQGSDRWHVWANGHGDCASYVITVCQNAGISMGGATYTGDMKECLKKAGWKQIPVASRYRGCVLLTPKNEHPRGQGHTAICTSRTQVAEALANEYGTATGGKPGDQTGNEVVVRNYNGFAYYCFEPPAYAFEDPNGGSVKLYIICGHGAGDPGAGAFGYNEAERVRALGKRIKELGGNQVVLLDTNRNWYADKGINSLNIPNGAALVELHMDSSSSQSARGGHVIIKSGFQPDSYDTRLAALMARVFPGRANTIVQRSDLANVNRAASRGINYRLVENGFITNKDDLNTFNSRMDEIAQGYLSAFDIKTAAPEPAPAPAPKPVPVPKRQPGEGITMKTLGGKVYRLFNPNNGDHLYTTDTNERKVLLGKGYKDEGELGSTPPNTVVVYRLNNVDTGEHMFTANYEEAVQLCGGTTNMSDGSKHGWQAEGEQFLAYAPGTPGKEQVYRLYAPGHFHIFTTSVDERDALLKSGYQDEGVAFSVDKI